MKNVRPVWLVGSATAFSLLGDQTLYAVLPSYFQILGLAPMQVALILSANRWIRLISNHWAEQLTRQYHLGVLLGIALGLGAAMTLIYGISSSFLLLLGGRLVWGICWSFIRQIGLMTVVDRVAVEHLGAMMGLYSGISRLGSIAGNLLGALGHDLLGFTTTLCFFALLSLVGVPLGVWARHGLQNVRDTSKQVQVGIKPGWGLLVCGFCIGCVGQGIIASTLGLMLKREFGEGVELWDGYVIGVATLTGGLLAVRWGADLLSPILGMITDRLGPSLGALMFFEIGALALGAVVWVGGTVALLLGICLFYVTATGVSVTLVAVAGARGSKALASYVTATDCGAALGPILGWLAPQWGLPAEYSFIMGGLLYLLGGGIAGVYLGQRAC